MDQKEENIKDLLKQAKTLVLSESDILSGVKLLKRIIKIDPKNYWAYVYYGFAAKKKSSDKEALQSYDYATKLAPDLVDGWKGVLSCINSSNKNDQIFISAYANLLRLEHDENKWNELLVKAIEVSNDFIAILGLCIDEDYMSSNFKNKISCRLISESVFKLEGVVYSRVILNAFKGYAFTRDTFDRPEFCQKAVDYFIGTKCFEGLFDFFYYTLLQYGPKLYQVWFISKVIVEISLYDIHKVEEILHFVDNIFSNEITLPITKKAFSVILFCKGDYMSAIEVLEPLSYMGDKNSSLLLMKCLMQLMDFDTVLYLATCLGKTVFEENTNSTLQQNFLECIVEALACSNDLLFLRLAIKLGMKALEKNSGHNYKLLFSLCYASVGLKSKKFFYYLNKLQQYSKPADVDFLNVLWSNNVLKNDSEYLLQLLYQGASKLIDGNMRGLIREYGHALKVCDKNFIFHTVLGVNYEAMGDVEKAMNCYDTILSSRSHDSTAVRLLCNILLQNGNEDEAINILENCCCSLFIKWHVTAEKVSATSGLLRFVKSDYHKALYNFSHALKLHPGCSEYLEMIAETYLCMNRFLSAENIYLKMLSSDLNNLHVMLSHAYAMKLNINYASYFNNSIHCINSVIPTKHCLCDYKNVVKLLITNFIHIYRSTYSQSVDTLVNLSFSKYLNRLMVLYCQNDEDTADRVNSQEYLIAVYCFLESHFIAATKYEKRRELHLAHELLQFCLNGICKVLLIYGSSHTAFWKLLGDVFLKCSTLGKNFMVPSWLFLNSEENPVLQETSFTAVQLLNLAIKCFTVGLKIVASKKSERVKEFYYDIAISFLMLANHPDIISEKLRYYYLKHSLRSAGASFINYDGTITNVWIFFNLIGVITSMMGSSNNFFKGLFDSFSVEFKEEFLINNKASFFLKEAMFKEAQELYEMCKLQGDTDYSSPWIGHFLTLLLTDTPDIKLKLQFLLKIQGSHKLLQWVYGITLFQNQHYLLEKGERVTLQKVFKEFQYENNVSRLTLLGYVKEMMGDKGSARKAYIRALRLAKYNVDKKTYDVLLNNAIRLSGRCNLGIDLLKHFNHHENKSTALIYLKLCHINGSTVDNDICKTISSVSVLDETSQQKQLIQAILSTILSLKSTFKESDLSGMPNVYEIICNNIYIFLKCSKSFIKKIVSSLPLEKQVILLRTFENLLCITNESYGKVQWLIPQELNFQGLNLLWQAESLIAKDDQCQYDLTFVEVPASSNTVPPSVNPVKPDMIMSSFHGYPYSAVLQALRNSMFPLPPSTQERFSRREQKIIDSQLNEKKKREEANSIKYSVSPLLSPSLKFDKSITITTGSWDYETHGCHKCCLGMLKCLFTSMKSKNYNIAAKYLLICLDVLCQRCFNIKELIPLISFLSSYLKNLKLLQKALHLYPNEKMLWKTLVLFTQVEN